MSQQAASQVRPPTSYPSPSMSSYSYPSAQAQQPVDSYRLSPTASHVSLPSLSLPPIRSIDPRNPTPVQAPMASPLPPGVAPAAGYFTVPGPPQALAQAPPHLNVTSSPHGQPLRYHLPAPNGRMMSGGRNKKEIKRRTKTGCLTCRRRRIKVCPSLFFISLGPGSSRLSQV